MAPGVGTKVARLRNRDHLVDSQVSGTPAPIPQNTACLLPPGWRPSRVSPGGKR